MVVLLPAVVLTAALALSNQASFQDDLAYLNKVAHEVIGSCLVEPGASIQGIGQNTTGGPIRVPGGTQNWYPAFWIRDAAMMLGADFVTADEVRAWVRLCASTQPGQPGLHFMHDLTVPPYSIPDHIDLNGQACWFPGAYAEQGVGDFGHLPPADDAFYYVQMVAEAAKRSDRDYLKSKVKTPYGEVSVLETAERAFASVETDPKSGLVVCGRRVDWGFCDSITKVGETLMPSLLRWQAAKTLSNLVRNRQRFYQVEANKISKGIVRVLYHPLDAEHGFLQSATELGKKDDLWASAFAIWLNALPEAIERRVANHLLDLYRRSDVVLEGQVRQIPLTGVLGGHWESAMSSDGEYQNGGYWATPTGWLAVALAHVDPNAGIRLVHEYCRYLHSHRPEGAPFEWINPKTRRTSNQNYGSSVGLVEISLAQRLPSFSRAQTRSN